MPESQLPYATAKLEVCEHTNIKVGYRTTGFVSADSQKRFTDGQMVTTGVVDQYRPDLKRLLTKQGTEYELTFLPMAVWGERMQSPGAKAMMDEWSSHVPEVPEPAQATINGHQQPKDPNLQE